MVRGWILIVMSALCLSACGSEPESVIAGDESSVGSELRGSDDSGVADSGSSNVAEDGATVSRDESPAVAEDSPPRFDEFCVIVEEAGPIALGAVPPTSFGGRWGDQERGVDSGRAETGFETPVDERPACQVDDVISDCMALLAFVGEVGVQARVTARHEPTEHDLDYSAASVGSDADTYARAINALSANCPFVADGSDSIEFGELQSETVEGVEARFDDEVAWVAALARENILVLVVVMQTGGEPLAPSHLSDFERVVELSRQRLDAAPIG